MLYILTAFYFLGSIAFYYTYSISLVYNLTLFRFFFIYRSNLVLYYLSVLLHSILLSILNINLTYNLINP
jgi:hypothetical protein